MKLRWAWIGPLRRFTSFGDPCRLWQAGGELGYKVRYAAKCAGVKVPPPHYGAWLDNVLLSKHKTKHAAMMACEKHAKERTKR